MDVIFARSQCNIELLKILRLAGLRRNPMRMEFPNISIHHWCRRLLCQKSAFTMIMTTISKLPIVLWKMLIEIPLSRVLYQQSIDQFRDHSGTNNKRPIYRPYLHDGPYGIEFKKKMMGRTLKYPPCFITPADHTHDICHVTHTAHNPADYPPYPILEYHLENEACMFFTARYISPSQQCWAYGRLTMLMICFLTLIMVCRSSVPVSMTPVCLSQLPLDPTSCN